MPFSFHSHSGEFCKHASGTLEEVVQAAVRLKFRIYGLTEHVPRYRLEDRYPEEEDLSIDDLEHQFVRFLDEGHRLKQKYKSEITLFVGAETEYITELDSTRLQSLLDHHRGRIEFLVGSIHHVNAIPIDFDDATFRRALESFSPDLSSEMSEDDSRISALLGSYLDSQYLLMQRFHPEIIGHLDLCRLYRAKLEFRTFPGALAKLQRNIEYACGYGALFELNAAAFRKGWDSAYPGRDVLQIIIGSGGKFTVSDDSHGPHAVGLNYDRLYRYMQEVGIKELWYLANDHAPSEGRGLQPAKFEANWWEDEFWSAHLSASMK